MPRPFGTTEPRLVSLDEGVGKIRAALAARADASLVVMARTGAVSVTGLGDALAPIAAYEAAGADAIFLTGVTTRAELDAIAERARLPLMLGTLSDAIADRAYLASRGVRIALQGHAPFQAATEAVRATLAALRAGVRPGELKGLARGDDAKRWMGESRWLAYSRASLLRPASNRK